MPSESDVRNEHAIVTMIYIDTLDVFAQFAPVVPVLLEWFWSAICKRSSSMVAGRTAIDNQLRSPCLDLSRQVKSSPRIDRVQQLLPHRLHIPVPRQLEQIDTSARARQPLLILA